MNLLFIQKTHTLLFIQTYGQNMFGVGIHWHTLCLDKENMYANTEHNISTLLFIQTYGLKTHFSLSKHMDKICSVLAYIGIHYVWIK